MCVTRVGHESSMRTGSYNERPLFSSNRVDHGTFGCVEFERALVEKVESECEGSNVLACAKPLPLLGHLFRPRFGAFPHDKEL